MVKGIVNSIRKEDISRSSMTPRDELSQVNSKYIFEDWIFCSTPVS
jgi:hypothetical protein